MFKPFEETPTYTARCLVAESMGFHKFAHFTLLRTDPSKTSPSIDENLMRKALKFISEKDCYASAIKKLGSNKKPRYVLVISFGEHEQAVRQEFSALFDKYMTPENNRILYMWAQASGADLKEPYISLGPKNINFKLATQMVKSKTKIEFDTIDYKRTDKNDPILTVNKEQELPSLRM